MLRLLLVVFLWFAAPVAATGSQPASDPRGIYLNQFTGGFAGTEWFQVTLLPGTGDRYRLADIHGGGFDATIREGGIVIDNGIGSGGFTAPDAFTVKPTLGGMAFTFESHRVPLTTFDFPLAPARPQPGNPALAGKWTSLTQTRDPQTGAVIDGGEETLMLSVTDTRLRITDPQGLYFQGVFVGPNRVVFRAIEGVAAQRPEYASFPGSAMEKIGVRVHFPSGDSSIARILDSGTPYASGAHPAIGCFDAVDELAHDLGGVGFQAK